MNKINTVRCLSFFVLILLAGLGGCTASRNITASGKVTPKGAFKVGFNSSFNIASEPISQIDDITEAAVDAIRNRDSIYYSPEIAKLTRGLVAYSLDPVGPNFDIYVRYGLVERVDVGYKYASGVHVLDAMFQFMGGLGTPERPGPDGLYGSIGLQYSGQKSDLPSKVGLDKLSALLTYEASRKDILIPLVFSKSLGREEELGNLSFGLVYGHSFINYGFRPGNLFQKLGGNNVKKIDTFVNKESFPSFGGFVNAKIGFKYAYLLPSLSIYHQNYGTYNLLGVQQESYKGLSVIPSIGVQVNINYGKARTR